MQLIISLFILLFGVGIGTCIMLILECQEMIKYLERSLNCLE